MTKFQLGNYLVKTLQHYSVLVGLFGAVIIAFLVFPHDKAFQVAILIAVAISYVVWGVVHHHIHKDLYVPVLIEYILVATLGLVIVFSLIFGA